MSTARRDRATELCRRLATDVARVAPPGLGTWEPAWKIISDPSDRFLDLLNEWEATGTPELRPAISEAYDAVVAAWTDAASRYTGRARDTVTV